jgi:hypothetical protein
MSTTLATIRKRCPVSVMQATTRRPDVGVEDEPDRVGLAADPERVEVQVGQPANLVGVGHDGLEDDSHREGRGGIEGCCDRLRALGDRLESLGAIEVLAPRDELDFVGVEIQR